MSSKMSWDGFADQQLLLSILAEHEIKIDFDSVARRLGCSARAVQERLKKLKKMAADQANGSPITPSKVASKKANGEEPPASKKRKVATPKSPKAARPGTGKVKGKKDYAIAEKSQANDLVKEEAGAVLENSGKRRHDGSEVEEDEEFGEGDSEKQQRDTKMDEEVTNHGEEAGLEEEEA